MSTEVAVIVTARNEGERLGSTLAALGRAFPGARVLVADDASGDATAAIARAAGAEVVSAPRRLGKGEAATLAARALLASFDRAARPSESPTVVLCDGDLGHSAAVLTALTAALERGAGDIVVAVFARRIGGGFGLAVAAARLAIAHRTGGRRPRAPLSGQRALRLCHLHALLPFARGFGMETAMAIDAHRAGLRLVEIELELEHRATTRTPVDFAHRGRQLAAILGVALSRRRDRGGRAPAPPR